MHHPFHHEHSPECRHPSVEHDGHVDVLCDGHLHHPVGDGFEEHRLEPGPAHPDACTPEHWCGGHEPGHEHDAHCGHPLVPHGDHVDYLVDGHLHHPHADHCDDHGPVRVAGWVPSAGEG